MIGWCILAFFVGLIFGGVLMAMLASKRLDDVNMAWYQTCIKITDGMDLKDAREVFTNEVNK